MDRVNTAVNENALRHRTHRVADIPRDNTSRHIRRTDVSVADKFDSTPEIDCFNNYSKTGQTAYSNNIQTADTITTKSNDSKNDKYSLFFEFGYDAIISKTNPKPPILFNKQFDPEIARINTYINKGIQDYIAGKVGADEIIILIDNAYRDILAYNISLGNTDGTDPYYNAGLLHGTQAHFGWRSVQESFMANATERDAYALENYGMKPGYDVYEYYNAKYFYLNKELQEINKTAITQIAKNEGFDFYNVQAFYSNPYKHQYCFNAAWQQGVGMNMKNLDVEPPKDFIMFYTAQRYNRDDWLNGENVEIFADDPKTPGGQNAISYWLKVPKGWSLFKNVPLWATQGTGINQDGESYINWDVTKHLNWQSGKDISTLLKEFFAEFVNNPEHGDLVIWSNGTRSDHDVLFCIFDDKRKFDGSEMTAAVEHNEYVKNFEFRVF